MQSKIFAQLMQDLSKSVCSNFDEVITSSDLWKLCMEDLWKIYFYNSKAFFIRCIISLFCKTELFWPHTVHPRTFTLSLHWVVSATVHVVYLQRELHTAEHMLYLRQWQTHEPLWFTWHSVSTHLATTNVLTWQMFACELLKVQYTIC